MDPYKADPARSSGLGRYPYLFMLTLVVVLCSIDRGIIAILFEPIRLEFGLHDWQLGLLSGFAFTLLYAAGSLVIARQAERRDRTVILSLAIAGWSVMTMVCGLAGSYVQLLLARMGVGLTEAACQPASHTLIADLFDERERPFAMGIFAAGTVSGLVISLPLGGWIAQHYGWRAALLAVGLPGLLLAVIVRLTLHDPIHRVRADLAAAAPVVGEGWRTALEAIARNHALRHVIGGSVLITMATAPATAFGPAYLIRNFGLSEAGAGLRFGLLTGSAAIIGNVVWGWITARLIRRSPVWGAYIPAIVSVALIPATLVFLLSPNLTIALAGVTVSSLIAVGWMAPTYAMVQGAAGPERRATAAACLMTAYTLIGFGLGPLIAGIASDLLKPSMGAAAIGGGLLTVLPFSLWACFHFWRAGRALGASARPDTLPPTTKAMHPHDTAILNVPVE